MNLSLSIDFGRNRPFLTKKYDLFYGIGLTILALDLLLRFFLILPFFIYASRHFNVEIDYLFFYLFTTILAQLVLIAIYLRGDIIKSFAMFKLLILFEVVIIFYFLGSLPASYLSLLILAQIVFLVPSGNFYKVFINFILLFSLIALILLDFYQVNFLAVGKEFKDTINCFLLVINFIFAMFLNYCYYAMFMKNEKVFKKDIVRYNETLNKDFLTSINNRLYFYTRMDKIFRTFYRDNHSLCLAMADLDHFKSINDKYGHDIGDRVLISFASIAKSILEDKGTVCRLGGEEFAIIFYNVFSEEAYRLCQRIQEEMRKVKMLGDRVITISFGFTIVKKDKKMILDNIIKHIDDLLYQAKENGRDRIETKLKGN